METRRCGCGRRLAARADWIGPGRGRESGGRGKGRGPRGGLGQAAGNPVDERVVPLATKAVEDGAGGKHLAAPGEDDLHGIDPALTLDAHVAAIGPARKHPGRATGSGLASVTPFKFVSKVTAGEIESPVGTEVGAVLIGAAVEFHGPENLLALVRDSVVIGVFKSPKVGRGDDVEGALVPEPAFRHGHLVREDGAPIENAIAIGVDQTANEAGQYLLDLCPGGQVASVTFRDVETTPIVEACHHGIAHERRGGGQRYLKSIRNGEWWRSKHDSLVLCRERQRPEEQSGGDQSTRTCESLALAWPRGGC